MVSTVIGMLNGGQFGSANAGGAGSGAVQGGSAIGQGTGTANVGPGKIHLEKILPSRATKFILLISSRWIWNRSWYWCSNCNTFRKLSDRPRRK